MSARIAGDAEIDMCPQCHGIWVDWFDGNLVRVARDAAPIEPGAHASGGSHACPRCHRRLHTESFRGARVRRCAECAGTFVERKAFDDLIALAIEEPKKKEPSAIDRLIEVVRWLVHGPRIVPKD
jgi:Zn-finger nucleic acid-binding protein